MKAEEVHARLASLTPRVLQRAIDLVRGGYGSRGLILECPVTLKQANAVHALVDSHYRGECVHAYLPYIESAHRCHVCGSLSVNRPEPA